MNDFNWREHISFELPPALTDTTIVPDIEAVFEELHARGREQLSPRTGYDMQPLYDYYKEQKAAGLPFEEDQVMELYVKGHGFQTLSEEFQEQISRALDEIASTPEGQQLIREAAANSNGGTLRMFAPIGDKDFYASVSRILGEPVEADYIALKEGHDYGIYGSDLTGYSHDFTLQRTLVHELKHIAAKHTREHENYDRNLGYDPVNEGETIAFTNAFMAKYYAEAPRGAYTDGSSDPEFGGTPELDYNLNFNPAGYNDYMLSVDGIRKQIQSLSPEEISAAGPEIEALAELVPVEDDFTSQYYEYVEQGSMALLQEGFRDIEQTRLASQDQSFASETGADMAVTPTPNSYAFAPS